MRIALCQVAATSDPETNLGVVADGVAEAAAAGCRVAVFPEATQARFGTDLRSVAEPLDGPWAAEIRRLAAEAGLVVVAGMFTPAADGRVRNTLLVTGEGIEASYDKIHLFDALGHRESQVVTPGSRLVTIDVARAHGGPAADAAGTDAGSRTDTDTDARTDTRTDADADARTDADAALRIGLATCYDVRFPQVFTTLARAGATAVVLPASWGAGPGKREQWELLVRARALDATAWLLACDQAEPTAAGLEPLPGAPGGIGHSLAVSPRGEVVGALGVAPGMLVVDVDAGQAVEARRSLPVLEHARALTEADVQTTSPTASSP